MAAQKKRKPVAKRSATPKPAAKPRAATRPAHGAAKTPAKKPPPVATARPSAPGGKLPLDAAQRARVAAVLDGAPVSTLVTPAELHYAARSWNWDSRVGGLREIVDRPDCALATASLVFWNGLPEEVMGLYATRDDAEGEEQLGAIHDLQLRICARVASGGYASHDIGYDPRTDGVDMTAGWQPDEAKHRIPDALFAAIPGRKQDPEIRF